MSKTAPSITHTPSAECHQDKCQKCHVAFSAFEEMKVGKIQQFARFEVKQLSISGLQIGAFVSNTKNGC